MLKGARQKEKREGRQHKAAGKGGIMKAFQARRGVTMRKVEVKAEKKTNGTQASVRQWDTGKVEGGRAKRSKKSRLVRALKRGL